MILFRKELSIRVIHLCVTMETRLYCSVSNKCLFITNILQYSIISFNIRSAIRFAIIIVAAN